MMDKQSADGHFFGEIDKLGILLLGDDILSQAFLQEVDDLAIVSGGSH